jgi:predicted ATPase/class 3 adenylate cyclase
MQALPHGTVTFLFTDIESSTRLWHEHADTMPHAYARHDTILREAIAANGGVVYKTVGDAFQVAFPTAIAGVNAARAAQRLLQTETWPTAEPLTVRMALHTGAVDPLPDGDYRSPVLNRLGRLLGAGHGGQVLVSQATMELARDHLPAGVAFRDLGEQHLKDLYRPERVYQLAADGIDGQFPPLMTLDARPNNLPIQPTQFIGRQEDVRAVIAILDQPGNRLVTLTGPGGMGKTRLALQVGADMLDAFREGVFFVSLDSLTDASLVPDAIGKVFRLREEPGVPMVITLRTYLHDRATLLVLDNLEQIIDCSPFIGALLAECPRLKVVATSRIRLQIRGEREYSLRPLSLPRRGETFDSAALSQFESVRLFLDRAQASMPDFKVTDDNAAPIAEICTRLDGLPLAIELAAARVRMLPPEAMLRRLSSRLPLLTGGGRDLPERQQTLRGAIAWSYELLNKDDRALFRRMSVFAGGTTMAAIETVTAGEGEPWDVFDGLERLVNHSLVRQTEVSREPLFSMFETIREYGLEELERYGESDEARRTHARYYAGLAGSVDPDGPELVGWLDRMLAEQDNVRAALGWAVEHDHDLALRLTADSGDFWRWRGAIREGRSWTSRILGLEDIDTTSIAWGRVLLIWSRMAPLDSSEHIDRAQRAGMDALAIFRARGAAGYASRTLSTLSLMAAARDDIQGAYALGDESIAIAKERGDDARLALGLNNYGYIALMLGDLETARRHLDEALVMARRVGSGHLGTVLGSAAELAMAEESWERAEQLWGEAVVQTWISKFDWELSFMLQGLIIVAAEGARWERMAFLGGVEASLRNVGDDGAEDSFDHIAGLPSLEAYRRSIDGARAALSESEFQRLWSRGAALPIEEALAEIVSTGGILNLTLA